MKHTVLLLILTLLLAGGVCGYAAADESLENITAEILAIAGNLDAAQTALSGTPLASGDVQDLIRIKNSLVISVRSPLF